MTSGGYNFNEFAENQLTKFSDREISVTHNFQGYFSRTKVIFQDFPGPGILKKKSPWLSRRHGNPVHNQSTAAENVIQQNTPWLHSWSRAFSNCPSVWTENITLQSGLEVRWYAPVSYTGTFWSAWNHTATSFWATVLPVCHTPLNSCKFTVHSGVHKIWSVDCQENH